jgi:CubicO group peptidase (beta-lactamase class C family)
VTRVHLTHILCVAVAAAFGMATFPVLADVPARQAPLELTADNIAGVVDPLMAEWIGKHNGPGAVVVVVQRDGPVFAKGYGSADIAAGKPFTADATLVRPGSISKLFTAIAVMQLVDAGRLDLDRDINGYIDFVIPTPDHGVPVTLRRLLTHRAGFEEHAKGLFSRARDPEPLGRWLATKLPRRLFPKGDVEAYSNYGFALAGYIVERAAGESFPSYVQRHILDPLGMRHSTLRQPLPDELAPLMAKGYRVSNRPPLGFFETVPAPAGGLSATGTDMGRFMRALLNGGELDGARIIANARLDEMMAPAHATPAGYLGLAFIGGKVTGHDAIGHAGATITFFSDLKLFRAQGLGIFVSRDGHGEIKAVTEFPDPTTAIAARFLPRAPRPPDARIATSATEAAGAYHSSRRAESSVVRLNELTSQVVVKASGSGDLRVFAAIWPFGKGMTFKRVGENLYRGPASSRMAFIKGDGSESYFAQPGIRLQRVPWWLDMRWIAPAFALSVTVILVTLLFWPVAALWRRWRKRRWSENRGDRRKYLAVRVVLLVDAVVVAAWSFSP